VVGKWDLSKILASKILTSALPVTRPRRDQLVCLVSGLAIYSLMFFVTEGIKEKSESGSTALGQDLGQRALRGCVLCP
jgi:hypothetical protein